MPSATPNQSNPATTTAATDTEMQQASSDESIHQAKLLCTKVQCPLTAFTDWQVRQLEGEFNRNMYVNNMRRIEIANRLSLHENQVHYWFQNRRMKYKKDLQGRRAKRADKAAHRMSQHNELTGTVQFCMPFSQDPALPQPKKCSHNATFGTNDIQESQVIQPPTPQPCQIIPAPVSKPSSFTPDLNEILNYLSEDSRGSIEHSSSPMFNSSLSNSSINLGIVLQFIEKDSEMSAQDKARNSEQWTNCP